MSMWAAILIVWGCTVGAILGLWAGTTLGYRRAVKKIEEEFEEECDSILGRLVTREEMEAAVEALDDWVEENRGAMAVAKFDKHLTPDQKERLAEFAVRRRNE